MKSYIGIDVGTSSVKLVLMNENGDILSQSSREYEVNHPRSGWSEIDPSVWYENMRSALHELLQSQDCSSISVIGVTGQMHTLILLDDKGDVLRPALMWNDKRTSEYIPFLREKLSQYPEGEYLSKIISTGSPLANLYWVSREEPETFAKCRKFLIGPDYIVYRLTGKTGSDFSEVSTSSMYCIKAHKWSDEIRNLLGFNPYIYPTVKGSCEFVGNILPELAHEFSLNTDVRIIAGTGDNAASAISTDCIAKDYPVLSLGTSGVLTFPVKNMNDVKKGKVILFSINQKSFSYIVQGVVQSVGECVNWWTRKISAIHDFKTLENSINIDLIRNSNLLFYPHINGDKTIYADPSLRGAFIGLSSETGAGEMYYALLEGLCFAFRQLFDSVGVKIHENLKVIGGGSKSDLWLQIIADVLNVKVERMSGNVGASFGISLLAYGADNSEEKMSALAASRLKTEKIFTPSSDMIEIYNSRYIKYLRIHDALKSIEK